MSNEFTPDEKYLKTVYLNYFPADQEVKEIVLAEFDRAITKIKRFAWREGYEIGHEEGYCGLDETPNPYLEERA